MRAIGFSTGALALGDVETALQMMSDSVVNAIELSALRQHELKPLIERLNTLNLSRFEYVAFHAPSAIERSFEQEAIDLLKEVASRGWPIIVHPDAMHVLETWSIFGDLLCIENMDKRKPIGQTANSLAEFFSCLPKASFCFDIGHARQVDPTMSEAAAILHRFAPRIRQLHVSEVNAQSKHDSISLESKMAFQRVAHLIPERVPIILESRVAKDRIASEINAALVALRPAVVALAGD